MRTGDSTEDVAVDDRLLTRVEPRGRHRRVRPRRRVDGTGCASADVRARGRSGGISAAVGWVRLGPVQPRGDLHVRCHRRVLEPVAPRCVLPGTHFALDHRVWDRSTGWTAGWSRVGGIATSDPDATSPGPEYPTDVFVRGSDAAVYQLQWNGAAWMTYALGGICTSGPSATYSGPHRLDVFCRGLDLALYHRSWRSDIGWSTGWSRDREPGPLGPEATSPDRAALRRSSSAEWIGGSISSS